MQSSTSFVALGLPESRLLRRYPMNNSSSIVRPSRSRQRNMVNVVNIDSLASLDWCEGSSWLGPDTTQGNCNEDHRMKIDRDLTKPSKFGLALLCLLLASTFAGAQQRRKVIINQENCP